MVEWEFYFFWSPHSTVDWRVSLAAISTWKPACSDRHFHCTDAWFECKREKTQHKTFHHLQNMAARECELGETESLNCNCSHWWYMSLKLTWDSIKTENPFCRLVFPPCNLYLYQQAPTHRPCLVQELSDFTIVLCNSLCIFVSKSGPAQLCNLKIWSSLVANSNHFFLQCPPFWEAQISNSDMTWHAGLIDIQ